MSRRGSRIGGVVLGVAFTFALVALSRVPYAIERNGDALIRLSWRTATAFVEECRVVAAEELETLPLHMRRERICEGRLLPYRLLVEHDGAVVLERLVHGAGARQDRPLSVFEELRVPAGVHRVRVRWLPERAAETQLAADDVAYSQHRSDEPAAGPGEPPDASPALEIETTLMLAERDVALITYDGTYRRLVVRGAASAAATGRQP
jgi:hypothetical protein